MTVTHWDVSYTSHSHVWYKLTVTHWDISYTSHSHVWYKLTVTHWDVSYTSHSHVWYKLTVTHWDVSYTSHSHVWYKLTTMYDNDTERDWTLSPFLCWWDMTLSDCHVNECSDCGFRAIPLSSGTSALTLLTLPWTGHNYTLCWHVSHYHRLAIIIHCVDTSHITIDWP